MMKLIGRLALLLWITACTGPGNLEDDAILAAKEKVSLQARAEAAQAIQGKEGFKKSYEIVIVQNTTFDVTKASQENNSASVVVRIKTVPSVVREKLLAVVERMKNTNDNRFNMNDALSLVREELKNTQTKEEFHSFSMRKDEKDGTWKSTGN